MRFISCPVYRDVDAGGNPAAGWRTNGRPAAASTSAMRRPSRTGTTKSWSRAARHRSRRGVCGGIVLRARARLRAAGQLHARHAAGRGHDGPGGCSRCRRATCGRSRRHATVPAPPYSGPGRSTSCSISIAAFVVYQLERLSARRGVHLHSRRPAARSGRDRLGGDRPDRSLGSPPRGGSGNRESPCRASIREALIRLGVRPEMIQVKWRTGATPTAADGADGLIEPSRRRVDIEVTP